MRTGRVTYQSYRWHAILAAVLVLWRRRSIGAMDIAKKAVAVDTIYRSGGYCNGGGGLDVAWRWRRS